MGGAIMGDCSAEVRAWHGSGERVVRVIPAQGGQAPHVHAGEGLEPLMSTFALRMRPSRHIHVKTSTLRRVLGDRHLYSSAGQHDDSSLVLFGMTVVTPHACMLRGKRLSTRCNPYTLTALAGAAAATGNTPAFYPARS